MILPGDNDPKSLSFKVAPAPSADVHDGILKFSLADWLVF
jgi:hypothetical protein